jgi:glucose/arabinose dehydrogenase
VPREGRILVLPDENGDGVADRTVVYASGLGRPHGLAFHGPDLFVAAIARLLLLRDEDGDLRADVTKIISSDIPGTGGHWTRSVVVGPDEMLYVSAGSSCNACVEEDPRRAAVLRFPLSGGRAEIFASGLRNSVGLSFHPRTGELWGSDNGRDHLGDELPPEEINRIRKEGDYGWPFCHGRRIPDSDLGSTERCLNTIPPEVEMPAHSAPLGIAFGNDLNFPEPYREMLYVALHGSWNRSVPTGYKLVGIPFQDGRPVGPAVDIVSGWLQGGSAWGRPVDPVVGADGALYLSDDRSGAIYRIGVAHHEGQGRIKVVPIRKIRMDTKQVSDSKTSL